MNACYIKTYTTEKIKVINNNQNNATITIIIIKSINQLDAKDNDKTLLRQFYR